MNGKFIAGLMVVGLSVSVMANEGHHNEKTAAAQGNAQETIKSHPINEWRMMLDHLKQPEYVHVLINPLPVWGMTIGILLLLGALMAQSRGGKVAGLMVIMATGIATWFVVRYGQMGYDRVLAMSNEEAQAWLKVHMARAEKFEYLFYLSSALALAALFTAKKWFKASKVLTVLALVAGVICSVLAGWISHAGGQVRHSEFREAPPPAEDLPKEHHHH